ncbi:hypothetical protein ACS0TY_003662 [Phlomoides rotata]
MNQCVPSWDLEDNPLGLTASTYSNSVAPDSLSLDYEVAELTWENGQLAMHGLAPSRVGLKAAAPGGASSPAAWDKPHAGGTLESIVNQATRDLHPKSAAPGGVGTKVHELAPWFDYRRAFVSPANMTTMDALVPINSIRRNDHQPENSTHVLESAPGVGTCMVGSCSVEGGRLARVGSCGCRNNASVSESATCGGDSRTQMTLDSSEREFGGGGLTSTSLWSPENTSSGGDTKTSGEDQDSVFHRRSQREASEKGKKKGGGKNSNSAKSRAAAIHNQSERKRRDKINQRMKTLQKLVPNSSKTDKASMLDEVIEYLKQLQAQVQMMSRMNMPTMMMQQQLQMSMMAQAMGMGMGMGVMDINSIGRAAAIPPIIPAATPAAFMPMPCWDIQGGDRFPVQPVMPDFLSAYMNCQSQPMTIDDYSRMAAMYQQFQQSSAGSGSKN